jgi:acetyl-CoA carboxylase biotin carboxylase subunit
MFSKVLVANRGEIAVRIIRACRELGIGTVAVYSQADGEALHVKMADEAVCIGPPPNKDSYLNIPNVVSAALMSGADAIHPGYGNLSENASFAENCEVCKITFIGPPASVIEKLQDKAEAKKLMKQAGVPVIPPEEPAFASGETQAVQLANKLGYPVMLKAALGGGGRGIRVVQNDGDMRKSLAVAQSEAQGAFGRGDLYMEKYIEEPRHIEFQILADSHGNIVHLGERDCSIQTSRYQKLLEESPSPALSHRLRERMAEAAVKAARAVGYVSAGTIEFLLDRQGRFYFLEMNTRLQVEHGVSEMVTGIDLVKEQMRIAAGERLGYSQKDIQFRGHAIECRITAEDPDAKFMPCAGLVSEFLPAGGPGVRVDTHLYPGYHVPPFYDPLLAKVMVWGRDRSEAMDRMSRALAEFRLNGLKTTLPFHQKVMGNAFFRRGEVNTNFIWRRMHMES